MYEQLITQDLQIVDKGKQSWHHTAGHCSKNTIATSMRPLREKKESRERFRREMTNMKRKKYERDYWVLQSLGYIFILSKFSLQLQRWSNAPKHAGWPMDVEAAQMKQTSTPSSTFLHKLSWEEQPLQWANIV